MDNQQPSNNIFFKKPKCGYGFIYIYTSPVNKVYIGQTVNSLYHRAKNIVSGIGYKKCSIFWKAIQKYQFSNFTVDILKEVKIEELNYWEEYYIRKYNSIAPNGYNLTFGGEGGKKVEVFAYSAQNGEFIEHYSSLSEAAEMTDVPIETISAILNPNNPRKIAHNLTFSKNYYNKFNIEELLRNNYRQVFVYDINGNFLQQFDTIIDASKVLRIPDITIRRHLNNGKKVYGYYFRDKKTDKIDIDDYVPMKKGKIVCQIDPNMLQTIAVFPSISAAARAVGLKSSCSITRAIERNGKAKGFYWKIIEGSTTKFSENPTELYEIPEKVKIQSNL